MRELAADVCDSRYGKALAFLNNSVALSVQGAKTGGSLASLGTGVSVQGYLGLVITILRGIQSVQNVTSVM